ncbi:ABC transporter permease [Streptomyces qinzhouensis]|uniref:FtsX-like permease family protein n=1 Tax=Streptomyces qinzhouensis TaxID=2599401 RepID=A0A5B8J724_9ACTN|nr:ABC transporter permease [Streptomyces qinzhouensis]QDY77157.1 FtsX-like permease family protein [Streptomyces qinzhouensis]
MTTFKTSLRNFLAHKGRMALSAIAVLLSVAFVCGTLVFTDTMNTTFDKLFAVTSSDVTVSPEKTDETDDSDGPPAGGRPATLPTSLVEKVAAAEGVKSAIGMVHSTSVTIVNEKNKNIGATGGGPTIAGNWSEVDLKTFDISSGQAPRGPTDVMVDADTAKKKKLKIGDKIRTITVDGDFTTTISGIMKFKVTNPGAAVVAFETKTAQRQLLGGDQVFTQIAVTAESGVSDIKAKAGIAAALGGSYDLKTAAESADEGRKDVASFLNVMKYAMLGFAGIALLVGIFLIVNTFSMLVAQRTREIGLMRAIGSSRKQVNRSVLFEAVLLGIVGSALGVAAGVGIAVGLMELMGSMGMELSTDDLTVKWTTPTVGVVLGIVVTVIAAYIPARRASRISPMAALRETGVPADGKSGWIRAAVGLLLTAGGALGLIAATQADKAGEGSMVLAVGVVLSLLGFIVIGPLLAGVVVRALSVVVLRAFGPVGRMAERNALRNPRRTGATGAALMIGLALVACLSVVGSSMVASATEELDKSVGADFIIQSTSGQPVVPAAAEAVRKTEGIAYVTEYRDVVAKVTAPDGAKAKMTLVATDPTYAKDLRKKMVAGRQADAYEKNSLSVGEEYAEKHGVKVGSKLTVAFNGGRTGQLTVRAISSDDSAIEQGAIILSTETLRSFVPAEKLPQIFMLFASAKDGQDKAAYEALKTSLEPYPQYKANNQADFKDQLKDQVGQMLNLVYGLLALAIIVAILGVVNTLALSVVERTREIGLMRAIGLSRRQLRRMIRLESVVIALFGALLGLGLGMGWGTAAQKLLALEGLGVLEIPWPTIITVFVGSAFVGLFAALVPAFRAGRMNVLNAIASD